MTKIICPECNGECYIDEEPCLTCEAGFMEEIRPEDYNTNRNGSIHTERSKRK
jgi:DnaJ-class molecular chaperone